MVMNLGLGWSARVVGKLRDGSAYVGPVRRVLLAPSPAIGGRMLLRSRRTVRFPPVPARVFHAQVELLRDGEAICTVPLRQAMSEGAAATWDRTAPLVLTLD